MKPRVQAKEIEVLQAADEQLVFLSQKHLLSLDLVEMKAVKKYFTQLGRNPTDCELETIAQTWSEHCVHRTFKALIDYQEIGCQWRKSEKVICLKEISQVTKRLNKRWCLSVFKDNAGVIAFTGEWAIAFKVETHNHPSALEPYGGAGTGIGGVIRDILGVGLGAKPILNTDVFCFGPLDFPPEELPEGVLHPRRIFKGVVSGVRDYGNRMGIPTANGSIIFDPGYVYNCLVFCGTLGLMPADKVFKEVKSGDLIVVAGGRTGRDGIHGATFSSASLKKDIPPSVVQIGHPIVEKKLLDVLLKARDLNLYRAITDCGAGGLSSAVGEMAKGLGAMVHLEKVPLKYPEMMPWEIWLSESQERMVLAVPPEKEKSLISLFHSEDVEATVIGQFENSGWLVLKYQGEIVGQLDLNFLHQGLPKRKLKAFFQVPESKSVFLENTDWKETVVQLLCDPVIASKEIVIRQYDHEVQGQTIIKPLSGVEQAGPSDAVVLKPLSDSLAGVVVSCGINPSYGQIDPYAMAGCCVEESIRNLVCVGGDPCRVALLDNFCWGNTADPELLGSLVRCVKGCRDFALAYGAPYISGKDSLNNFYRRPDGSAISIPGTLLISAVSVIPDVRKTCSSDLKRPGNYLYLCGETRDELGGSRYYHLFHCQGGKVPIPRPEESKRVMKKLYQAIRKRWVKACHDCSEGGFIVALSEMVLGGTWGAEVDLTKIPGDNGKVETCLFSESQGRFIVEVAQEHQEKFEELFHGLPVNMIGQVIPESTLTVRMAGKELFHLSLGEIARAWQGALSW
ncbi:MAG: phosphoribosylformylglycinamidine synthase subunit PurL [Candidatus Omnitrophica bacterium]|nr:phosphoribosylformylglycinamidine synthase subunit PurL [Candidatus Omnitrophota bacterium]